MANRMPWGYEGWPQQAKDVFGAIYVDLTPKKLGGINGELLTVEYQSRDARDPYNDSSMTASFFIDNNRTGRLNLLKIEADPLLRGRGLYPAAVQRAVMAAIQMRPENFLDKSGTVTGVLVGEMSSQSVYLHRRRMSEGTQFDYRPNLDPFAMTPLADLIGETGNPPPISSLTARARSGNLYSDLRDGFVKDGVEAFISAAKALRPTLADPTFADDRLLKPDLFRRDTGESHYAYAVRFLHPVVRKHVGPASSYAALDALATHIGLPLSPQALEKRLANLDRAPSRDTALPLMSLQTFLERAAANPSRPSVRIDAYLKAAEIFKDPEVFRLFNPERNQSPNIPGLNPEPTIRRIGNTSNQQIVIVEPEHFEAVSKSLTNQNLASGGSRSFTLINANATPQIEESVSESKPLGVLYYTPGDRSPAAETTQSRLPKLHEILNRNGVSLSFNDPRNGQYYQFSSGPAKAPVQVRSTPIDQSR